MGHSFLRVYIHKPTPTLLGLTLLCHSNKLKRFSQLQVSIYVRQHLYMDLASHGYSITGGDNGLQANLVRFGINYHF